MEESIHVSAHTALIRQLIESNSDYRGLKTRIEDIQAAQETSNPLPDSIDVYPDFPSARSSISDAPRADVLAETRGSSTLASAKSSGPDLRISPDTPDSEGLGNEKEVRKSLIRMFSKNNVNGLTRIISRKRSASLRPSTSSCAPTAVSSHHAHISTAFYPCLYFVVYMFLSVTISSP